MKFARIIIVAGVVLANSAAVANNDPARFWISTSKDSPIIGEAPSINLAVGRQRTLYIWAQPATDADGEFRTIQDFSLDIVTQAADRSAETQPFIDFVDGSFIVYNPSRFQYVADSLRSAENPDLGGPLMSDTDPTNVSNGQPDAIKGLQGLSINTANMVGIGHDAEQAPYRVGNAWRVAEVGIKALPLLDLPPDQNVLENTLFLQIGYAGMLSEGSGDTYVLFGDNVPSETTTYNASWPKPPVSIAHPDGCTDPSGCPDQREQTLSGDTFDIKITEKIFNPGDYDSDGVISAADFTYWRSSYGQSVAAAGDGADGNGNTVVDASDYVFWRKKMASGSGSTAMVNPNTTVPEPGTSALAAMLAVVALFFRRRAKKA